MEDIKGGSSRKPVALSSKQENVPIKVKKRYGKTVLIVFLCLFALLVVSYAALTIASTDKSLPYLSLVGSSVGNKSKAEVFMTVKRLAQSRQDQKITIKFSDSEESKSFKDIGLDLNINQTVEKIYSFGKINGIFPSPQYILATATGTLKVQPLTSWNSDVSKQISDMVISKKKNAEGPKIKYADGNVQFEEEKDGYSYVVSQLKSDLETCYLKKTCNLVDANRIVLKSNVSASELMLYKDQIAQTVNQKISLKYGSKKFTLNPEDIVGFIDPEQVVIEKKVAFNDQAIDDYLDGISGKVNTKGKNKVISTYDGSVLSEGTEGVVLDVVKSRDEIKAALENKNPTVQLLATTSPINEEFIGPGFTPGKYPGKFIEVNLSEQMLYLMEGTNNVGSYRVSTGKWSMQTPTGEYSINDKTSRAYSATYELYMPWWMSFIGSQYGIHELPEWPDGTKEGEGHLGTPVSHGCIRLGVGSAEAVYNWTDVGTPVYIHR